MFFSRKPKAEQKAAVTLTSAEAFEIFGARPTVTGAFITTGCCSA